MARGYHVNPVQLPLAAGLNASQNLINCGTLSPTHTNELWTEWDIRSVSTIMKNCLLSNYSINTRQRCDGM